MNGFKFDFSKIFWGGAHWAPSPDPSPQFFSGFALGSGFALNSRVLPALDSGFALDTRALRALDSGFALNFRLGTLVWPPKINSWIRPCSPTALAMQNSKYFPVVLPLDLVLGERYRGRKVASSCYFVRLRVTHASRVGWTRGSGRVMILLDFGGSGWHFEFFSFLLIIISWFLNRYESSNNAFRLIVFLSDI